MRTPLLASVPLLLASACHALTYTVHNNCPTAIDLFIADTSQGSLPRGAKLIKTDLGTSAGFFYTTTHGGRVNGQLVAARAGFFFEPNYWYYYLVRDSNPDYFNTGISIVPSHPESGAFCRTATCNDGNCTTAYTSPPSFHGGPPPADSVPYPPVYQCKYADTNFDITFCPSGNWPTIRGAQITPNANNRKCVDVRGAVFANGTPVQIYDCNDTNAQRWIINRGSTKVRVGNTNFCLDAGSNPASGVKMKIWQCYDNLPAQQWYFTDDNRIALEGKGLCLDLTDGNTANSNVLQTWTCTDYNNNQAWFV